MLSAVPTLGWDDNLFRLALAAVLGGAIGFEREYREREAGLRTHLLVCVGSALFTIISADGFHDFLTSGDQVVRTDPTRIAAQIVSTPSTGASRRARCSSVGSSPTQRERAKSKK